MIRWFLALLLLLLGGCVTEPDPRPDIVIDAERKLEQGVDAFRADRYQSAAALFSSALSLFRSIDNREGIMLSYMNLAETALVVGHYEHAETQLKQAASEAVFVNNGSAGKRLRLLRAALQYRQGELNSSVTTLQPLLPDFDDKGDAVGEVDDFTRVAVADRARLSFQLPDDDPAVWLLRLEQIVRRDGRDDLMMARLERLLAEQARSRGDLMRATEYLDSAIQRYKARAYRRGIAAALLEKAQLLFKQNELQRADDLLRRALEVRLWILDRPGAVELVDELIAVNRILAREAVVSELEQWRRKLEKADFTEWERLKGDAGIVEETLFE